MELDDALILLGEFGWYQTVIYLILSIVGQVSSVWHMLGISFLGALPDHRCKLSADVPVEVGIPKVSDGNGGFEFSSCDMYVNSTSSNETTGCDEWVYDDNVYGETIVTEWDLVCEKQSLVDISQAVFMCGVMIGSVLVGHLSDRFGRRIVWLFSLWMQIIVSVITTFSQSFIMFTSLRFIIGVLEQGVDIVSYVMVSEMFSPRRRAHATIFLTVFWATGIMLLPWMAFFIQDWRWLQLALTLPWLLTLPLWWFLPESTRWLISRGRIDEAEEMLQKIAKFNKRNVPYPILSGTSEQTYHRTTPDIKIDVETVIDAQSDSNSEILTTSKEPPQPDYNIADLFKTKSIRKITLFMIFIWYVNSLVYYGLSLNTGSLSGDPYMNFFLSGLVEIPAYIACPFIIQRFGRRSPVCIFHVVGGLACIATAFIPPVTDNGTDLTSLILTTALIGKFGITASYAIVFLYTTELYPTVIRNLGVGVSSFSSRIGGIIAPFILLLDQYVGFLPLVILGIFSIVAGFCVLLLPETLGRRQPMTIEEVEIGGGLTHEPITENHSL